MIHLQKCSFVNQRVLVCSTNIRKMTTTEVSTALRPFYFSVHPDLFGQHPNQRITNENSLKQLSSFIQSLQTKKVASPCTLHFYIRDKKQTQSDFRFIKIYLKDRDLRKTILTILKSCELSTEYVDKIPNTLATPSPPSPIAKPFSSAEYETAFDENDPIYAAFVLKRKIKATLESNTLHGWLNKNYAVALELTVNHEPLREEVKRLRKVVSHQLGLLDIRWECGWNEKHFRGCLRSLQAMAEQHQAHMHILQGRILVFAPFTGVSLDGHIMLNSGEVRHNWLDLIKNVQRYDKFLLRIPYFERAISQLMLNIKVVRRKFMPKIVAEDYERNLQQLATNIADYLSRRSFPKSWPTSLQDYQIVVETEAGPLMLSPTGQFIAPSTCPGSLLINFLTENLNNAKQKMVEYKKNKHTEKILHQQTLAELQLLSLHKDDNITPDLMIKCCEQLLCNNMLLQALQGLHLFVTTYYSVLDDGTVCIPWNFTINR